MALIKLALAPIRGMVNFPLVQLAASIAVIRFLQAAGSKSMWGTIFSALDLLVDYTVRLCAAVFEVKSFTRAWLTTGFTIGYIYVAGWTIILVSKYAIRAVAELVARHNTFGLRHAIARERGFAAYRAWLRLERIRPALIAQDRWEEKYAWPAGNRPPYPPWTFRLVRAALAYLAFALLICAFLQAFTPFRVLSWLAKLIGVDWI
jgi:hypothetical protein